MPDPVRLQKAQLRQLDSSFKKEIEPHTWTTVQFNPETLKVSISNSLKTPEGSGQSGKAALQYVGAGATKLSLQLWFDVNAPQIDEPKVNDVRKLTQRVAYFITPKKTKVPPIARFIWGTFLFDGVMESLEESLEMFSPDGRPLRASVTVGLTQQRITPAFDETDEEKRRRAGNFIGTEPMAQAKSGSTVQGLASDAGRADEWQDIAASNDIENPRKLQPGQIIAMNRQKSVRRRR